MQRRMKDHPQFNAAYRKGQAQMIADVAGALARQPLKQRCGQFLARFGPPVLDSSAGVYACRFEKTAGLVMRPSAQKLGGVRWWFVCRTCDERCGFLRVCGGAANNSIAPLTASAPVEDVE
jgi:hypothetical protein